MKLNINNIDMTLKEAKKILEKEGFKLSGPGKPGVVSEAFAEYESPEICEAMQIVCSAGYEIMMLEGVFEVRKERLKKEYEKNTKAPCSGEEQPKEKKGIIYPTTFPKADFYHKHVLNEGNPALAESASRFNDALLDEQAKEIKRLKKKNAEVLGIVERMKQDVKEVDYKFNVVCKENERLNEKIRELIKEKSNLEDQITILNACKKHNDKIDRKQIKCLGKEIAKLNGIIHDKNAILSDVAEELRLTKIREKNLVEVSQKYMKEIEELNEKAKPVNMHRHKELAEKDEVIDKLTKENNDCKKVVEEFRNKIADMTIGKIEIQNIRLKEKDEVIADLTHELKAKHKKYVWYKGAYDAAQQILNTIADYAAKHPDKKFSDQMVGENHPTEDNPEEIEIEEAVKVVRKAMKEGHTVTIDCKD